MKKIYVESSKRTGDVVFVSSPDEADEVWVLAPAEDVNKFVGMGYAPDRVFGIIRLEGFDPEASHADEEEQETVSEESPSVLLPDSGEKLDRSDDTGSPGFRFVCYDFEADADKEDKAPEEEPERTVDRLFGDEAEDILAGEVVPREEISDINNDEVLNGGDKSVDSTFESSTDKFVCDFAFDPAMAGTAEMSAGKDESDFKCPDVPAPVSSSVNSRPIAGSPGDAEDEMRMFSDALVASLESKFASEEREGSGVSGYAEGFRKSPGFRSLSGMEGYRSQAAARANEEKRRRFMSERRNSRRRRAVSLK